MTSKPAPPPPPCALGLGSRTDSARNTHPASRLPEPKAPGMALPWALAPTISKS